MAVVKWLQWNKKATFLSNRGHVKIEKKINKILFLIIVINNLTLRVGFYINLKKNNFFFNAKLCRKAIVN